MCGVFTHIGRTLCSSSKRRRLQEAGCDAKAVLNLSVYSTLKKADKAAGVSGMMTVFALISILNVFGCICKVCQSFVHLVFN